MRGHCFAPFIVDDMGEYLTFESVCPEVEGLGLGTPRETIRLVNVSGDLEDWGNTTLLGTKSHNNYTSMMATYTASRLRDLDTSGINGYILKALSPSCGLRGIPVYPTVDTKGRGSGKAQAGMFAKALMELWPELPVEDEGRLADVSLRHSFYTRVEAHRRWRRMMLQRKVARDQGRPFSPLLSFHQTHLLLADSHDATCVPTLEALAQEATTASQDPLGTYDSVAVVDNENELYHRYYHAFFIALKRTGGRASTARCLRHCLAILEGRDDQKEVPDENESETAAEGETRRKQELENGPMLGMLLEYEENSGEVGTGAGEINNIRVEGQIEMSNAISTTVKPMAGLSPETATSTTPWVRRVCVIDNHDAVEIAESIRDYYNAQVPLSMPLGSINRQLKRLVRERGRHEELGEKLNCDMGEFRGTRALNLLENQAFLQPHQCKRVLSTIRQNKFGQTFEPSHAFMCL